MNTQVPLLQGSDGGGIPASAPGVTNHSDGCEINMQQVLLTKPANAQNGGTIHNGNGNNQEEQERQDVEEPSRSPNSGTLGMVTRWFTQYKTLLLIAGLAAVIAFVIGIVTGIPIGIGMSTCNGTGQITNGSGHVTSGPENRAVTLSHRPCRESDSCVPLDRWVQYNNTAFYYSEEKLDWLSSKRFCEDQGAVLAVITDPHIKENMRRFKKYSDDHWIGAYEENGVTVWLNATMAGDKGLNSISGRKCKKWNPSNTWEGDCSDEKPFICIRFQNGEGADIA
ncbi:early activation antigen CD69-like isoform X2 [Hyperolius riggenbachi]